METSSSIVEPLPNNTHSSQRNPRDDAPSSPTSDTGAEARPAGDTENGSKLFGPSIPESLETSFLIFEQPVFRIPIILLCVATCAILSGFLVVSVLILSYPRHATRLEENFVQFMMALLLHWGPGFIILIVLGGLVLLLASTHSGWRRGTLSLNSLLGFIGCGGLLYGILALFYDFITSGSDRTMFCGTVRIWDSSWLPASQIGALPQTFRACETRVAPQQAPLFTESIYWDQYPDLRHFFPTHTSHRITFNENRFLATRNNSTLCYPGKEARNLEAKGFQANEDLYGQGVRVGIYLNWVASLVANQLLAVKKRRAIQKAYLLTFNTILCIATYFEILQPCVFGIEMEVLYWAYWGGAVCVFSSAPNETRLGDNTRWTQLDWLSGVRYISNGLMTYHGIWFTLYGYDHSYAKMPCGTQQFIAGRLLDPSPRYCWVYFYLRVIVSTFAAPLAIGIPFVAVLLASEVGIYLLQTFTHFDGQEDLRRTRTSQTSILSKTPRLLRLLRWCKRWHGRLREFSGLPFHAQPGIRLITPLDEKNRKKYRIYCAGLWLASFILSVTGIEATLRWNNVDNIDSFNSTGQYLALPLGLFVVMDVVAKLWQQEKERRRQLICRQVVGEELELADFTLRGALQHAASQPDIEFYMSGGLGDPS